MKLKTFSITSKAGQVLNWSLSLFVVFSVFNLVDGWTSTPNDGQGVFTQAFATLQGNDCIRAVEYFMIAATKLTMLETFRRCLNKNGYKAVQLILTIMMALIFSLALADILPMFLFSSEDRVQAILNSGLPSLFTSFSKIAYLVLVLTKFILCVQLVKNFAGKIRLFGVSLFGCQLLSWVIDLVYLFVYTYVGGVSMADISTLYTFITLFNFVILLLPFCILKNTMVKND